MKFEVLHLSFVSLVFVCLFVFVFVLFLSRPVWGARGERAEEAMGEGSSREAPEPVGEGPAQPSLQHLLDKQRSVGITRSIRVILTRELRRKTKPVKSFVLWQNINSKHPSVALWFPLAGEDPLAGPLSQPQGDATDGPEPDPAVDEGRLEPRSDDEDT